jgi:hypothetical protein
MDYLTSKKDKPNQDMFEKAFSEDGMEPIESLESTLDSDEADLISITKIN